jgi:hypothetical protein
MIWTLSYKCPDCDALHKGEGELEDVIRVARDIMASGDVMTILIQERTTGLIAEMDMTEDALMDPVHAARMGEVFRGLK